MSSYTGKCILPSNIIFFINPTTIHGVTYIFGRYTNFNSSKTDGSFIMANSNSFLSPYEILPIAQENKYLAVFLS